jgi:hypothetical protein
MSTLFTELMFGSLGRQRALRLVHDGKCPPPPDTYSTVGMITRVSEGATVGPRSQVSAAGMILRFRDDNGQDRPYFVWWCDETNTRNGRVDSATRIVAAAAKAFDTVGRPVMITVMDGGDA